MPNPRGFSSFFRRRIKDIVLGANDGIITTFAIVTGVVGADLASGVAVILGMVNLFADGLSMGASNYLGRKSESDRDHSAVLQDPLEAAFATSSAFMVAGFIPLIVFIVPVAHEWQFPVAVALTATALFVFGSMRSLVTRRSWVFSGLEMLLIGSAAAGVAYGVGWCLRTRVGIEAG